MYLFDKFALNLKFMKKIIFLAVLFLSVCEAWAQDDPIEPIISAFQESDVRALAATFNNTIELSLPDHENTYSASQGEMILKDFFKKYPLSSFTLIQKGNTDANSKFAICDYLSAQTHYQVYIQLRKEKEHFLIFELKFEEKKR
jgi:hypothetical protein